MSARSKNLWALLGRRGGGAGPRPLRLLRGDEGRGARGRAEAHRRAAGPAGLPPRRRHRAGPVRPAGDQGEGRHHRARPDARPVLGHHPAAEGRRRRADGGGHRQRAAVRPAEEHGRGEADRRGHRALRTRSPGRRGHRVGRRGEAPDRPPREGEPLRRERLPPARGRPEGLRGAGDDPGHPRPEHLRPARPRRHRRPRPRGDPHRGEGQERATGPSPASRGSRTPSSGRRRRTRTPPPSPAGSGRCAARRPPGTSRIHRPNGSAPAWRSRLVEATLPARHHRDGEGPPRGGEDRQGPGLRSPGGPVRDEPGRGAPDGARRARQESRRAARPHGAPREAGGRGAHPRRDWPDRPRAGARAPGGRRPRELAAPDTRRGRGRSVQGQLPPLRSHLAQGRADGSEPSDGCQEHRPRAHRPHRHPRGAGREGARDHRHRLGLGEAGREPSSGTTAAGWSWWTLRASRRCRRRRPTCSRRLGRPRSPERTPGAERSRSVRAGRGLLRNSAACSRSGRQSGASDRDSFRAPS